MNDQIHNLKISFLNISKLFNPFPLSGYPPLIPLRNTWEYETHSRSSHEFKMKAGELNGSCKNLHLDLKSAWSWLLKKEKLTRLSREFFSFCQYMSPFNIGHIGLRRWCNNGFYRISVKTWEGPSPPQCYSFANGRVLVSGTVKSLPLAGKYVISSSSRML